MAFANVFNQNAFGRNPPTVILLDPPNALAPKVRLVCKGLWSAHRFLPYPTPAAAEKPGVVSFDVQSLFPVSELESCDHGTITAMKVTPDTATGLPGFRQKSRSPPGAHTSEFAT